MKHLPKQQLNPSRFALVFLLFMSLFLGSTQGWGQCTTSIYGQFPLTTVTATTSWASISTSCFSSEYSVISVTCGSTYQFRSFRTSNNAARYTTVTNADATINLAFGNTSNTTAISWTSTYTGTVRMYTHSASNCSDNGNQNQTRQVIFAPGGQPTATAGGVQTICQGSQATVSGASSSNGTIAWTENGSGSITSGASTLTPVYTASSSDISQITLTMTVSNGCSNATANYTVYVTANPTAGTLAGTQNVCSNSTTTFTVSGSSGGTGVFSTSNSAIATVDASTGVVTGVSAGTATITYTVTGSSGCVATTTRTVTVATSPSAVTISPTSATICNGDIQSLVASGGVGGIANAVVTSSAASGSINLAIPDNSAVGVPSTLAISNIPSNATITKIDVTFNLTHAWLNDAEITLTAPNLKVIALAADQGPAGPGTYSNTVITSDNTASALSTTATPITGTFRANATSSGTLKGGTFGGNLTQAFSDLFTTPNGSWKITAFDDASTDLGTLVSWSIVITYSTPQITWSPTTSLFTNAAATTSYTGASSTTVYAKPTETITYTATATSAAGCQSSSTIQVTVTPTVTINAFSPSTSTRCQGAGTVTTTTTASNSTGITYGLDATTAAFAGNSIVAATGAVTYAAGWSGTTTITASATGCNGPSTTTHVVTVTPTNTAGSASSTPTLCINTALSNITIATTGATGISNSGVSGGNGLPAGVAAAWASNTITISGTPTASGTFNYSIPLTGGCGSVNATGTITVTAAPSAGTLSGTQTICSNGSTTFSSTVSGGAWSSNNTSVATVNGSTGAIAAVAAGTATMTYTVTGTGGCSNATATRTVTVNALPTATISASSSTTFCQGGSVVLTSSAGTSYLWSNGATTPSITVSTSGSYTVTVTNSNGCSATSSATAVTVNPTLTASVSIAASATGICSGNSVTFTATPTNGGSSPAYVWKKNGVVVSGQNTATFITGSLANGDIIICEMTSNATPCLAGSPATSNSLTITVNPIVTPTFTQVAAICSGASLSALPTTSTNSITGTWSPALNNTATTTYTFTPSNGQCALTASMTITVNALPTATVTAGSATTFCQGGNVVLTSSAGTSYLWSNGATTSSITVTTSDSYSVTVTNANGCSATSAATAVTVTTPTLTYYADADGDNFGAGTGTLYCINPGSGYSNNNDDCDDNNAAAYPDAEELCTNTFDDNCDGNISEEFGGSLITYYLDQDADGTYSATGVPMCAVPANSTTQAPLVPDCNDNNPNIKPGGTEICGNEIDEDCTAGDLVPGYYKSIQSGAWNSDATWSYSCDNSVYNNAYYFPPVGYNGFVLIAEGTTVTIPNNGEVYSTGTMQINTTGSLSLTGNNAVSTPTAGTNVSIAQLTVSNTIINNGTLTVGHMASLLQSNEVAENVNTGNGQFNVTMNLTGTANAGGAPNGRYWYIGSPMNNTNISSTFYSTTHKTRIWDYLPATNAWNAIINGTTGFGEGSATNMTVGLGYLYRAASNQTVTFTGNATQFNNNITTPLAFTGTGYKYVSNPYTSYVDWRQVTRTGLNVSYWIRNAANTSYESFNATSNLSTNNGSGQTTQFIPPMQGFWIYAFTTPCSLRMDNGDRIHSSNVLHAPIHNQVVRLNLNDGKTSDQAVVYENENASNGIEEYDTDKFMDENHHQVYFLEGTKQVSLDGLKDATAKQKVDMGIQITSAGTYTINAVELGVEEDVMLEDKFTHTFQDMKLNNTYSFTANAGTFNNRFVLHFTLTPAAETAMETVEVGETVGESEGVNVYTTTGQQVKVWVTNTTDFQNATVKVYDAIGNLIERKNMTSNELLLDLDTATGVYLVEVTGDSKVFTKKIFISK